MPLTEVTRLAIKCDNPSCPGTELDPTERTGWLFVSHEIYGEPTEQHVFCSSKCVSAVTADPVTAVDLGFTVETPTVATPA